MANAARVYVGGLRPDVSERELEDDFGRHGQIRSIWVARKPPGFAFVEFEDPRDAEDAVKRMDGVNGWRVEVSRRPPGGGGGGGGRRDDRGFDRGYDRGGYDDYGRGPPRGGRGEMRCYECNEIGHLARDCIRRRRSPPPRRDYSPKRRDYSPRRSSRSPPRRRADSPPRRRDDSRSPPRTRPSPPGSPHARRDDSRGRSPLRDSPVNGRNSPPVDRSRSRSQARGSPRDRSYSR